MGMVHTKRLRIRFPNGVSQGNRIPSDKNEISITSVSRVDPLSFTTFACVVPVHTWLMTVIVLIYACACVVRVNQPLI